MRNTGIVSCRHPLRRIAFALGLCAAICAVTPGSSSLTATAQMGGPNEIGQWGTLETLDTVPVHISLLPDGRLLYWGRDKDPNDKWDVGGGCNTYTWHPSNGAKSMIRNNNTNLFCSGHSFLPDGRLLVAGGHVRGTPPSREGIGETEVNIFDYRTNQWSLVSPGMPNGRWYPSTVALPNGEVAIFSGYISGISARNDTPDLFTNANTIQPFTATSGIPVYPYLHVGVGGKVFIAGSGPGMSKYFDRAANGGGGSFTDLFAISPLHIEGSAVTYSANPSKVMMVGGHNEFPAGTINYQAQVIDLTAGTPWQLTSPLLYGRKYHTATVLPDGKVLVAAGTRCAGGNDIGCADGPARHPELWNPDTGVWTEMAASPARDGYPNGIPRSYHSMALLLPDGRVLVGGGGLPAAGGETVPKTGGGTVNCTTSNASSNIDCRTFGHRDVEFFSPPYLFTSSGALAARPRTTAVPSSIIYGQSFNILKNSGINNVISAVALIRLPSVTHGFNFDQRRVALSFTTTSSTSLSVTAPINNRVCPPGHYMLFLINSSGVPSVASIVRVGAS